MGLVGAAASLLGRLLLLQAVLEVLESLSSCLGERSAQNALGVFWALCLREVLEEAEAAGYRERPRIPHPRPEALNAILRMLYPNQIAYVVDNQDMTMQYVFGFQLGVVDQAVLSLPGLLPKPVGVYATVVQKVWRMLASQIPVKVSTVWAANASGTYVHQVPIPSQQGVTPGAASFTDGFPPLTFVAGVAGGIPPFICLIISIRNLLKCNKRTITKTELKFVILLVIFFTKYIEIP